MVFTKDPIQASEDDLGALRYIAQLLEQDGSEGLGLFAGSHDDAVEIPNAVREVVARAVHAMLQGDAVAVSPVHAEMTTQEAADYLAVSRPYLISLLEAGEIPYTRLKSHRRLRFSDVEAYRSRIEARRMHALDDLTREMYEAGLYTMEGLEETDA